MSEVREELKRAERLDDDAAWLERWADREPSQTCREALRDEAIDLRAEAAVIRIFATPYNPNRSE